MSELNRLRKQYGMSGWYETKGLRHANWELDLPRDNYDLTCAIPLDWLTEVEKLCAQDELMAEEAEAAESYQRWVRQMLKAINSATKAWTMPKRFTFYCLFVYRGGNEAKTYEYKALSTIVKICFPLQRDRKRALSRARELCAEGRVRLTQDALGFLVDRSRNQIGTYVRQIKHELIELHERLNDDAARLHWTRKSSYPSVPSPFFPHRRGQSGVLTDISETADWRRFDKSTDETKGED